MVKPWEKKKVMSKEAARSIKYLEYVTDIDRCIQESPQEVRHSIRVAAPTGTAQPVPRALRGPARPTTEPDTARRALVFPRTSNTKHGCSHKPVNVSRDVPPQQEMLLCVPGQPPHQSTWSFHSTLCRKYSPKPKNVNI